MPAHQARRPSMEGYIDLRPSLMLLLLGHAPRQRKQFCERRFEPAVTIDLATDVTDDAAEIGP